MTGSGTHPPKPPDTPASGALPAAAAAAGAPVRMTAGLADWERDFYLRWGDPDAPLPQDPYADWPEPGRKPQDDEDPTLWITPEDYDPGDRPEDAEGPGSRLRCEVPHDVLDELPGLVPPQDGTVPCAAVPEALLRLLTGTAAGTLTYQQAVWCLEAARDTESWLQAHTVKLEHRLVESALAEHPAVFEPGTPERVRVNARELAGMSAAAELACLLKITERVARQRLDDASELCSIYQGTLSALEAGRITRAQAEVILSAARTLPPQQRAALEAALLEAAPGLDLPTMRRKARRACARLNPESLTVRRRRAETDRHVELQPGLDGMAYIGAVLPAEVVHAIYSRITCAAKSLQGPDEDRNLSQLRADVFADLLTRAGMETGPAAGIRAEVMVTVPVFTLMGLSEEPAELEGYGPIPADAARLLCANAPSFHRILTHPETGIRLSYGRTVYRVPKDLARAVRHRNPRCTFAGCRTSARYCELDHTRAFANGGETSFDNLGPGCKTHHRLKHTTDWTSVQHPGGIFAWTSPAGRTYTTVPDHVPDRPPGYPQAILKHLPTDLRRRMIEAVERFHRVGSVAPPGPAKPTGPGRSPGSDSPPF
jgi:hypothetical protein